MIVSTSVITPTPPHPVPGGRRGRDTVVDVPARPEKPTAAVERIGPPLFGTERETLRAFLEFHRATLAMKCEGLTEEQLKERSSPPSTLSLIRHTAEVERAWFRRMFDDNAVPMVWSEKEFDFRVRR